MAKKLHVKVPLIDGNNNTYDLNLPDSTSWTEDKTVATTDDIGNGTLTIQGNGTAASTFTANQSGSTTLNIKGSGATTVSKTAANEITVSSPADTNQKVKAGETTFGDNAVVNLVGGNNITVEGAASGTGAPKITISTPITVSAANGVSDGTNTYKYTHPSYNATTADLYKIGRDSTGHVVIGDAFTIPTSFTISVEDNILDGTGGANSVKYAPYTTKGSGHLYTGTANPDSISDRLNYDGYFYATKLYSGGVEVKTTDNDHYPTTFTWTNGTTAGPTGSLTGNSGFTAVSFGAIPAASTSQSGVITIGDQTFAGDKTFNGNLWSKTGKTSIRGIDSKLDIGDGIITYSNTPSSQINLVKTVIFDTSGTATGTYTLTLPNKTDTIATLTDIPTVNNGALKIYDDNGALVASFTANQGTETSLTIQGDGITKVYKDNDRLMIKSTEVDTLASVTGRGATTSTAVTMSGGLDVTGNNLKVNKISAPITSGGSTYGTGSNGQILKANGSGQVYWASDEGGAHTHSGGVGLIRNGNGGETGDVSYKVALVDETKSTNAASYTVGASTKFYAVQLDKNDKLGVYVPWTDYNTTYTIATGDSNGQIKVTPSSGSAYNVDVKGLGAAAYKGTTTSVTSGSTDLVTSGAVYDYVSSLAEPMVFKGGATITKSGSTYIISVTDPSSASDIKEGYTYKVTSAPSGDANFKAGDTLIAAQNNPGTNPQSHWTLIPSGDEPSGTVTSVALRNGSTSQGTLSISGSPITSSGTIDVTLASAYGDSVNPYGSKTANTVLAAPNGSNGTPSFRALAAADIPNLNASKINAGTFDIARIPTGTTSTTVAKGDHTHDINITSDGSSPTALSANTTYTLTAGGKSVVFTTPADANDNYYHTPVFTSATSSLKLGTGTGVSDMYIPYASLNQAGIVSTGTQTFSGAKTFNNSIKVDGGGSYCYKIALDQYHDYNTFLNIKNYDTSREAYFNIEPITGTDKTITFQDKTGTVALLSDISASYEEITWAALKTKRDNNELVPGQQYKITDYTCTTTQAETSSAGHDFDIIVIADTNNTLNENARASTKSALELYSLEMGDVGYTYVRDSAHDGIYSGIMYYAFYFDGKGMYIYVTDLTITPTLYNVYINNGDPVSQWNTTPETLSQAGIAYVGNPVYHGGTESGYFADCDLAAWELKYCIDNDTDRFAWADSKNGKGVIYWMKDEWGNEAPYDFKNILFRRYSITAFSDHAGVASIIVSNSDYYGLKTKAGYNILAATLDTTTYRDCYTFQGHDTINSEWYDVSAHPRDHVGASSISKWGDFKDLCVQNKIGAAYIESVSGFEVNYSYHKKQVLNNLVLICDHTCTSSGDGATIVLKNNSFINVCDTMIKAINTLADNSMTNQRLLIIGGYNSISNNVLESPNGTDNYNNCFVTTSSQSDDSNTFINNILRITSMQNNYIRSKINNNQLYIKAFAFNSSYSTSTSTISMNNIVANEFEFNTLRDLYSNNINSNSCRSNLLDISSSRIDGVFENNLIAGVRSCSFGDNFRYNNIGTNSSTISGNDFNMRDCIFQPNIKYIYIPNDGHGYHIESSIRNIIFHAGLHGTASNSKKTINVDRSLDYTTDIYPTGSVERFE